MSQSGKKNTKNKTDYAKLAQAEAQKKAEAEAERLRQEKAAEEARLAAIREAEEAERRRAYNNIAYASDEDKEKDLKAWLQTVPLSETCIRRIDRDFSDGALLAEVIHHYCPHLINKREYRRWYSKENKIGNWEALNNKVFSKMGFRINRKQIANIVNPYACGKFQKDCAKGLFIYKLLFRVREILAESNPSVYTYRKQQNRSRSKLNVQLEKEECFMKPKKFKRKLVNLLENPCYSRIEMLIDQGFYERADAKPPIRRPACFPPCASIEREKCCKDEKEDKKEEKKKPCEEGTKDDEDNLIFFPCDSDTCQYCSKLMSRNQSSGDNARNFKCGN